MFKIIVMSLVLSGTASATTAVKCDFLFQSSGVADVSSISATSLIEFPNLVDVRIVPAKAAWREKNQTLTNADVLLRDALGRASESYSVVRPSQLLPLTFKQHGDGFYFERIVDWTALIGQSVVGYKTLGVEYLNMIPGVGYEKAKTERLHFAGVVTAAEVVNQKLKIILKTPSETEIVLEYPTADTFEPFLVLAPKVSREALLRRAFSQASFENIVGEAFGVPSLKEDYDMAAAIVETAIAVPVTSGRTAVAKILLGRSVRGGEAYAHYGLARGKKRYAEKRLQYFIGALYEFMEATGVMSIEARDTKGDSPDWLANFNKTSLAGDFNTIWQELKTAKGGGDHAIVEKKPRAEGSLKLSRAVAKPGTFIAVQSGADFAGLSIGDDFGQTTRFIAAPGQRLEIIKAPRTVRSNGVSLSLIRLRDPSTGTEGEVFWTVAMKFTLLAVEQP